MNNSRNNVSNGVFKIVDTKSILKTLGLMLGLIVLMIFCWLSGLERGVKPEDERMLKGVTILLGGLFLIIAIQLKAELNGTIINIGKNTMEFPGDGLSANGMSDYFKLNFLLRRFKRFTVPITSISEISKDIKVSVSKEGKVSETYYLIVIGTFGSLKLTFASELKRNELYSLIREVNRMGSPIYGV